MNINDRIDIVTRVIDVLSDAIIETEGVLAQMKASRMEQRVLLDDLKRQRDFTLDDQFAAASIPDDDDLWEVDQARLGEELKYRVEGS